MQKKRILTLVVGVFLIALLVLPLMAACAKPAPPPPAPAPPAPPAPPPTPAAPEKIRMGASVQLSGWAAPGAETTLIREWTLWVEQTNAKGGIYVKEYDKRIPVELILFDNKSDTETAIKMVEKLILEEKVDFLLPPWGTAFNFAVAPVASKYKYILISPPTFGLYVKEVTAKVPYFFAILNQPPDVVAGLVELLQDLGVKSVALFYVADSFGIEGAGVAGPMIEQAGIEIAMFKSWPLVVTDLSPVIKELKARNIDNIVAYSYPDDGFLFTKQSIALDYNPKLLYLGPGVHWAEYRDTFGVDTVEGIMGVGAWNKKVDAPGAREFFDAYLERWGVEIPRWGEATTYAALQILEKAIEITGTLDQTKLRDVIASETFMTVNGPVKFVDGVNIYFPGQTGQWQKGEYEIISPKDKRTAQPIYPKPPWPK